MCGLSLVFIAIFSDPQFSIVGFRRFHYNVANPFLTSMHYKQLGVFFFIYTKSFIKNTMKINTIKVGTRYNVYIFRFYNFSYTCYSKTTHKILAIRTLTINTILLRYDDKLLNFTMVQNLQLIVITIIIIFYDFFFFFPVNLRMNSNNDLYGIF